MKEIPLSQGYFAIVDDEDFEYLNQFSWHVRLISHFKYARTNKRIKKGKQIGVHMHREIMNCPENMMVDHINGNGLDNRKCNLRIVTRSQNLMNSKKPSGKHTSIYKGVSYLKLTKDHKKVWRVEIRLNKKGILVGSFETEIEAAKAYNKKAIELFGEFAKLNEIKK